MSQWSGEPEGHPRPSRWALAALVYAVCVVAGGACFAEELPAWTQKIRKDHPRLFFNSRTWPAVRDRALGAERPWYLSIKERVDRLAETADEMDRLEVKDYGFEAAWAAFVYRVTQQERHLDLAKKCLDASLRFYDVCYDEKKSVNWYSMSRVHATLAWDWIYEDLSDAERRDFMSRLVRAIDRVLRAKPPIYRENMSGYLTGFYGVRNCLWFIGCTAFGTGIEPEKTNAWLLWGLTLRWRRRSKSSTNSTPTRTVTCTNMTCANPQKLLPHTLIVSTSA